MQKYRYLLVLMILLATRLAAIASGLQLDKFLGKEGFMPGAPNIHPMLGCEICHAVVPQILPPPKPGTVRVPRTDLFIEYPGSNEDSLCLACHEDYSLHPYGINPSHLDPPMVVPDFFPLGSYGSSNGKVVCTTCHSIHADTTLNSFLRGLPENVGQIGQSKFRSQGQFCRSCHSSAEGLSISPHDYSDTEYCIKCHKKDTDFKALAAISDFNERVDAAGRTLIARVDSLCGFCHSDEGTETHYLSVNAFADEKLKGQLLTLKLPMINGKFSCVTCHDPHGKSQKQAFLFPEYIFFTSQSNRIIPHHKDTLCSSCHMQPPKPGQPFLKFDGDIVNMCNWCHASKEAKKDIHPVGMVIKENRTVKAPEKLPLSSEKKIDCLTCHYAGNRGCLTSQEEIELWDDPENSKFIRGGLPQNIWDFCYACHIKQNFKKFNAHVQIDKKTGQLIEKSCVFCHLSRPDQNVVGMEKKNLRLNPVFICLGCHPDRPHPGTKPNQLTLKIEGVFHLVAPVERPGELKVPEGIILSERGRITCVTCHNPHQKGVIRTLRQKGADAVDRQRFEHCTDCHVGK